MKAIINGKEYELVEFTVLCEQIDIPSLAQVRHELDHLDGCRFIESTCDGLRARNNRTRVKAKFLDVFLA